jgi:hypothetical protein
LWWSEVLLCNAQPLDLHVVTIETAFPQMPMPQLAENRDSREWYKKNQPAKEAGQPLTGSPQSK